MLRADKNCAMNIQERRSFGEKPHGATSRKRFLLPSSYYSLSIKSALSFRDSLHPAAQSCMIEFRYKKLLKFAERLMKLAHNVLRIVVFCGGVSKTEHTINALEN